MEYNIYFILFTLFLAYTFDFINGFHDAANSIATIVTTGVLTPKQAVLWAAFFNFIAFIFFHLMVAKTIGNDLIDGHIINAHMICSALLAAIFWNLLTWYFGIPSSSSHALIGGLAGAAIVHHGFTALKVTGFLKVTIGIFIVPAIGLIIGLTLIFLLSNLLKNSNEKRVNRAFKGFQLASSALLSLTHGANDAQKTMGIITVLLFSSSLLTGPFHIPVWVVISCQAMISLGTLAGGWRIVHTMGHKITQLNTMRGCAAETGAALIICVATYYGIPVSTTQTVTGAIAGVGLVKGLQGTQWPMLKLILISWLITIPSAGLIAAFISYFLA